MRLRFSTLYNRNDRLSVPFPVIFSILMLVVLRRWDEVLRSASLCEVVIEHHGQAEQGERTIIVRLAANAFSRRRLHSGSGGGRRRSRTGGRRRRVVVVVVRMRVRVGIGGGSRAGGSGAVSMVVSLDGRFA